MGEGITVGLRMKTGLRAKLVRAMVVTLVAVTGATVVTVGYMNYRSARGTLDTIETQLRQSIARKGQGLATNDARALRGLVADNAFGDVAQLVERSVHEDEEMLYGLFLGADGKVWSYVPPAVPGRDARRRPDYRELGIDPAAATRTGPEAVVRDVAGQEAFEFSASVASDDGDTVGRVFYGLSSAPLQRALSAARREFQRSLLLTLGLLLALGVVATSLGFAVIRGVAARIINPLGHLTSVATAIADGRKDQRVSVGLDSFDDELGVLGRAFNQMLQELDGSYKDLERLNRTLEHRVDERTRELAQRNRDMRLVLDNVNQGFLTMSRAGILAEERSAIVGRWLGPAVPNQSFTAYVGQRDRAFAEAFQLGWEVLLEGLLPIELCLAQLPRRLRHDARELEFSYHLIQEAGNNTVTLAGLPTGLLIVVNDITEQVKHARQEAERSELLAMVQGFMSDRSGFLASFDEVRQLLEVYGDSSNDTVTRKRALHTIKGNAGLAGFRVIADLCHRAEEQLADGAEAEAADTSRALFDRWQTLSDTLAAMLGERGRDIVEVQASDLAWMIEELRGAGTPGRITARLSDWTLEPVERPLARLARYGGSLAQRLGKGDIHVEVDGGGVRVDPQRWKGLWSELVHVVRNAIDHGMETADERRALSKPAQPRLRLRASSAGGRLVIDVEDDGRGIDWEAVRAIARRKGLPAASPEELTAVLLAPDVTTRPEATLTSGRGMGLAAVAGRVRDLGGEILVESRKGQGTHFQVSLPLTAGIPQRTTPAAARNIA
jgi:two-component system chemotaxis sensor kinase CheA